MKKIRIKFIKEFLSLCLLFYYLFISWGIHRSGYEHPEAMFLSAKLKELFESQDNSLIILGTTYPSLVFLSSLVFSLFGNLIAPILASIALSVTLFYIILIDIGENEKLSNKLIYPIVFLLFLIHPGLLYSAVSGRGIAVLLLFFYMVFRNLLRYYKTQTTFYLSMASIYLSCLIFSNYDFIWLMLAFLPFIVMVSLEGLKLQKDKTVLIQYFNTLNNHSKRRKLVSRTISIYFIVFLLPIGSLFLFRLLNQIFASDPAFFLHSQFANWHVQGDTPYGELIKQENYNDIGIQSQLVFQVYVTLINPLLILLLIYFKGKMHELFTLLSPYILMGIVLVNTTINFTIEYYLVFLILALVGLGFYGGTKFGSRTNTLLICLMTILNILGGFWYFNTTRDTKELSFISKLKNTQDWRENKKLTEDTKVSNYIYYLTQAGGNVLIDNAISYEIIAHIKKMKGLIFPTDGKFVTAIENPLDNGVEYFCIANETNIRNQQTVLTFKKLKLIVKQNNLRYQMMYQSSNWTIYRVEPNDFDIE